MSYKTKIHLALLIKEYIRTNFLIVPALPGTVRIHCVKEDLQRKMKTIQFKSVEYSIIQPLKQISNEIATPVQEKVVKKFAISQYVIVKYENFYYTGEILQVLLWTSVKIQLTMERNDPKLWKLPSREDVLKLAIQDMIKIIKNPLVPHRGSFSVTMEL